MTADMALETTTKVDADMSNTLLLLSFPTTFVNSYLHATLGSRGRQPGAVHT